MTKDTMEEGKREKTYDSYAERSRVAMKEYESIYGKFTPKTQEDVTHFQKWMRKRVKELKPKPVYITRRTTDSEKDN